MSEKSILMINYYYPPLAGMGMIRALKFARYLPENGWVPIVLTPRSGSHVFTCDRSLGDIPEVTVLRTGYFDFPSRLKSFAGLKPALPVHEQAKLFGSEPLLSHLARKSLGFFKNVLLYPDPQIGWYRSAVREGLAAIDRYRPAVIFSSSPPATSHLVARKLKAKTGIPWVADLRDLWSDNHQIDDRPRWRGLLEARTEKKTLTQADGIVTVTDMFASNLRSKLGLSNGWQTVIPNSFDPADFGNHAPDKQKKFTISHLGDLWGLSRDPSPLFRAISSLAAKGVIDISRVELNFYGNPHGSGTDETLRQMAKRYGLDAVTKVGGSVSHSESLALQQRSTILLVVEILTEKGKAVIPGKLFEHLGARRPTLGLVPQGGEVSRLLQRTKGGMAFDPRLGEERIGEAIAAWYREWEKTGTVAFEGNNLVEEMTRPAGARQLAEFLNQVISKNAGVCRAG